MLSPLVLEVLASAPRITKMRTVPARSQPATRALRKVTSAAVGARQALGHPEPVAAATAFRRYDQCRLILRTPISLRRS